MCRKAGAEERKQNKKNTKKQKLKKPFNSEI